MKKQFKVDMIVEAASDHRDAQRLESLVTGIFSHYKYLSRISTVQVIQCEVTSLEDLNQINMKTLEQHCQEQGALNDQVAMDENKAVMQDVLKSCFDLCVEGVKEFKKCGMLQAAEGCDACAANILQLAQDHNIKWL